MGRWTVTARESVWVCDFHSSACRQRCRRSQYAAFRSDSVCTASPDLEPRPERSTTLFRAGRAGGAGESTGRRLPPVPRLPRGGTRRGSPDRRRSRWRSPRERFTVIAWRKRGKSPIVSCDGLRYLCVAYEDRTPHPAGDVVGCGLAIPGRGRSPRRRFSAARSRERASRDVDTESCSTGSIERAEM